MKIIGVTGGIGTGKSTVSSILHNLGAKIIDADIISRQIVCKESLVLKKIVEVFGNEVLDVNGDLNRIALAQIVFTNSEALNKLNLITHPVIGDKICQLIEEEKIKNKVDTIVVDAAIPFIHGFRDTVEEIWVIIADRDIRVNRIMARNNISKDEAINRINSQMSENEYLSIADIVIENNGDITELEQKVVKQYYFKSEGTETD